MVNAWGLWNHLVCQLLFLVVVVILCATLLEHGHMKLLCFVVVKFPTFCHNRLIEIILVLISFYVLLQKVLYYFFIHFYSIFMLFALCYLGCAFENQNTRAYLDHLLQTVMENLYMLHGAPAVHMKALPPQSYLDGDGLLFIIIIWCFLSYKQFSSSRIAWQWTSRPRRDWRWRWETRSTQFYFTRNGILWQWQGPWSQHECWCKINPFVLLVFIILFFPHPPCYCTIFSFGFSCHQQEKGKAEKEKNKVKQQKTKTKLKK